MTKTTIFKRGLSVLLAVALAVSLTPALNLRTVRRTPRPRR